MTNPHRWALYFDADDTLWHTERAFQLTHERFKELLSDYADGDHLAERLLTAERANLGTYGYGIKAFVLSMIECALEVTEDRVPGAVIAELVAAGREMLDHPIELLPGVAETLAALAERGPLAIITKGDLLDQERKVAQSGLGDLFRSVHIVSEKTPATYRDIFGATPPAPPLMVGNSVRSDILAPLEAGAVAAWIPYETTWALEVAEFPAAHPRAHRLNALAEVPLLLDQLEEASWP